MVCPAGQGLDVYLVGDLRDCEGPARKSKEALIEVLR
jgi:hypothetical protein